MVLINCSCTAKIDSSLFEFTKRPPRSKTDAQSHLLVWAYRKRRAGLYVTWPFLRVSQRQHINWLKHEQWQNSLSDSYDRIASNNVNGLLDSQRLLYFWESGGEVPKIFVRGKIVWNHFWKHRSRYQALASSLLRETVFLHRQPKTEFITERPWKGQPSNTR